MANKWICFTQKEIKTLLDLTTEKEFKTIHKKLSSNYNKKRISVASAKGKGRSLQYWICNKISSLLNIPYIQSDDSCLIHSREMGQHGVDIILRGEALKRFPYSIESKSSESLNLMPVIEQIEANQKKDTDWLIVHKRKALPEPIVIMTWRTFEKTFNHLPVHIQ
jgi:hypothetical protein